MAFGGVRKSTALVPQVRLSLQGGVVKLPFDVFCSLTRPVEARAETSVTRPEKEQIDVGKP
jgi:hypothetical protein